MSKELEERGEALEKSLTGLIEDIESVASNHGAFGAEARSAHGWAAWANLKIRREDRYPRPPYPKRGILNPPPESP